MARALVSLVIPGSKLVIEVHWIGSISRPHVDICSAKSCRARNLREGHVVCGDGPDSAGIDQCSNDRFGRHSAVAGIRPAEDFIDDKEHWFLIRRRPDRLA
jgi:hypothetical protein